MKTWITYSVDGDTTTTNSSVGVDEGINDLSSKEDSATKSPKIVQPQQQQQQPPSMSTEVATTAIIKPDHFPFTTTILMELPTANQERMEIQTDRVVDMSPTAVETLIATTATASIMPITKAIPSAYPYHNNMDNIFNSTKTESPFDKNVIWNIPNQSIRAPIAQPIFSLPLEEELPSPMSVPTSLQKVFEQKNGPKAEHGIPNPTHNSFWGTTSTTVTPDMSKKPHRSHGEEWPKSYFGTILDKVTKIPCITNCSDIDLARCDDTVEHYVESPLNTATKRCSGKYNRSRGVAKHRLSEHSLLQRDDPSSASASNSMYTENDYEDDDLGTYDDSMISASLFDIDTLEDEYTYTTYENDDDEHPYQHGDNHRSNSIRTSIANLPLDLQKSLLSDPSCNTSKYMVDDDGTSYSSQNSAWL